MILFPRQSHLHVGRIMDVRVRSLSVFYLAALRHYLKPRTIHLLLILSKITRTVVSCWPEYIFPLSSAQLK